MAPSWPSLYNPTGQGNYLYDVKDVWRFTLIWTVIFYAAIYGFSGLWGLVVFRRYKSGVFLPIVFILWGLASAVLSATIVGFVVGAVYAAGDFRMSTWIPFTWALVQALIVVMGSYSTVTTLL